MIRIILQLILLTTLAGNRPPVIASCKETSVKTWDVQWIGLYWNEPNKPKMYLILRTKDGIWEREWRVHE